MLQTLQHPHMFIVQSQATTLARMAENRRRPSRYPRFAREPELYSMDLNTNLDDTLMFLSDTSAPNPMAQQPHVYSSGPFIPSGIPSYPEMNGFIPYGLDDAVPNQQTNLDAFYQEVPPSSSSYTHPSYSSTHEPFSRRTTTASYYSASSQSSHHQQWLSPNQLHPSSTSSSSSQVLDYLSAQYSPSDSSIPMAMESSTGSLATSAASTDFDDTSPTRDPKDLSQYGIQNPNGTWRCAYPGCSSSAVFRRGCDLRKHFNRHRKYLFCRYENCPQAVRGGFSSKKDRDRHEAKHNPEIPCEWEGCHRLFSRVDNMKDHVRRIHRRHE